MVSQREHYEKASYYGEMPLLRNNARNRRAKIIYPDGLSYGRNKMEFTRMEGGGGGGIKKAQARSLRAINKLKVRGLFTSW